MSIILPGINYQVLSANAALLAGQAASCVDVPIRGSSDSAWISCQASTSHLFNAITPFSSEGGARCYNGSLQIIGGDASLLTARLLQENTGEGSDFSRVFWDFAVQHPLLIPSIPLALFIAFMSIRAIVSSQEDEDMSESPPSEVPAIDKDLDAEESQSPVSSQSDENERISPLDEVPAIVQDLDAEESQSPVRPKLPDYVTTMKGIEDIRRTKKYMLIEMADGTLEMRLCETNHRHHNLILSEKGEKVVGAGHICAMMGKDIMFDGKSVDFSTFKDHVVINPRYSNIEAAEGANLARVESYLKERFKSVRIKRKGIILSV